MPEQPETPPSPLVVFLTKAPILGIPNWIVIALGLMFLLLLLLVVAGKVPKSYNLLNIRVRWKTTALTAVAFTVVIGLLTVMLAFVNGAKEVTEGSGQPGNVLVLSQGATDETFSDLGFSNLGDIENQAGIEREGDRPLVSRELFLAVNQPIPNPVPGRPKRRFLQLRGLDDAAMSGRVHGLSLHAGGAWFSDAGVREREGGSGSPYVECVVGEGIAQVLAIGETAEEAPARLTVGDTFTLNDRQWLITGVLQSAGTTFDSEIWAKRSLVGPMFGKSTYTTLVCRAADGAAADELARFFREDYTKAALNSITEMKYFDGLNDYNKMLLSAIMFVTGMLAVGGVFGVMNTMFAAISQRTKDIGVLRLMGYGRRHIVASFLLEALVIGLIGGVIGCAIGSLWNGVTVTSILASGGGGGKTIVLTLTVDAAVLAAGILLTLVMALIGGLLPALNAMRLTALEALR